MLVLTWHDIVARWFTISKVRARDGAELGSKVAAARPGQRNTNHHRHTSALVFCHGMPRILSGVCCGGGAVSVVANAPGVAVTFGPNLILGRKQLILTRSRQMG